MNARDRKDAMLVADTVSQLHAEIERLRAEKTDLLKKRNENEMQKMIDYWGRRAEKAEAELQYIYDNGIEIGGDECAEVARRALEEKT